MTRLEEAVIKAAREMSRGARVELYERLMIDRNDVDQTGVDQAWQT
jgi:hypothetical protein